MSPFGLSCDSLSRFCIACFMYFVNSADTREQFLVFKSFFLKCNKLLKIVCTISSFINLDVILLTAPVRALSLSSSKSILSLQFLKVLQNWFQLATKAHLDISSSIITGIVKISPILFIRKCHCIPSKIYIINFHLNCFDKKKNQSINNKLIKITTKIVLKTQV